MINFDAISERIFNILKGFGLDIEMFTLEGRATADPAEAKRFFVKDPNLMVTVESNDGTIKLTRNKFVPLNAARKVIESIKVLAMKYLLNFDLRVFGEVITPKKFAYQAAQQANKDVMEASMSPLIGFTKTSYQYVGENTRLIIRHSAAVDENVRGARSRNIKSIYIENNGEKTQLPFTHLLGARAMARHLSQGGIIDDSVGNYIMTNAKQYGKLKEFIRYTNMNGLLNDNTSHIIQLVRENIGKIRHNLRQLSGPKTYNNAINKIESVEHDVNEDEVNQIKDMFTVRKFEDKFEEILPTVNKFIVDNKRFYEQVNAALDNPIQIPTVTFEDGILEFEDKDKLLAYKLSVIAGATNDEVISEFVSRISEKLKTNQKLNIEEANLVRKFLKNAKSS